MLEDHPNSIRDCKPNVLPHYPMRQEFKGVSYAQRYIIFCERLVRERLYNATCFIMSSANDGSTGKYSEPNQELSFRNFAASLSSRAGAFVKMKS